MAFRNSILAGEELVRSGIRSPNYAAGAAGWRIGKDGSAEFNNVTLRGHLLLPTVGIVHTPEELVDGSLVWMNDITDDPTVVSPTAEITGYGDPGDTTVSLLDLRTIPAGTGADSGNLYSRGEIDLTSGVVKITAPDGIILGADDVLADWTAYTPALVNLGAGTNWALGNGSAVGYYWRLGHFVAWWAIITWGGTSTFGTKNLAIGMPFTTTLPASVHVVDLFDASGSRYQGEAILAAGSASVLIAAINTAGTFATLTPITNAVPFAWTNGDAIVVGGTVRV